jgi:hypothetical protein
MNQCLREEVYSPTIPADEISDLTTKFSYIWTVLKFTLHITRMVCLIAFVSPDSLVINSISLCDQIFLHLSNLYTVTNPATETKSIGLPADVLLPWFLQLNLESLIFTRQLFSCLPGPAKTLQP